MKCECNLLPTRWADKQQLHSRMRVGVYHTCVCAHLCVCVCVLKSETDRRTAGRQISNENRVQSAGN